MDDIWAFLKDPNNREILAWLGGGVVVVAGGVWAVVKFLRGGHGKASPSVQVTADRGGVAAGRDAHVADRKTTTRQSR